MTVQVPRTQGRSPFPISGFRGLNLSDEPDQVAANQCLDGLNFELDRHGGVRTRDGYAKLTASAGATRYDTVAPVASGTTNSSSGPNSAGTGADDSSLGVASWSNPSNIISSNNSYATVTVDPTVSVSSHYLKATNFGFAVPGTATILGVVAEVEVKTSSTGPNPNDAIVRLVKGGVIQTVSNKALGTVLPTADTYRSYGSATDLWGTSLTAADVNAATFGFVFLVGTSAGSGSAIVSVDHMRITVYWTAANTAYVLAGATGARIDAINSDGSVATTVAGGTDQQASYANFGSPTTSATYIAVGSGALMRKYSVGAFSTVAGSPKARYVAVLSPDNRLVAANVSTIPTGAGSTANTSLVHFSDALAPETWSANNYVYLSPGDGEDIQGMAAWSNQLYIFKSTKAFVYFGTTTDSNANPVFNFRPFPGLGLASPLGLAPSPHGVFVCDRRGIYLFTGASTERISTPLDPLFLGNPSPFFLGGVVNPSALNKVAMAWMNDRLYIGYPSGSSATCDKTLVWDYNTKQWLLWDMPMGAVAAVGSQPATLVFAYGTGTFDLGQYRPNAYTDDAGTAITGTYRSGFYTVGNSPSMEATVIESALHGSGSPSFALSRDFDVSVPTAGGGAQATVTLGTSPAFAQGWHTMDQDGRVFSYQLSGAGPWQVTSITHHVSGVQEAGLQERA